MKHIDFLQIALIANLVAVFVAITTAGVLAWNNSGSKNIPLAAAALIGVLVGYLIQLPFELARSTSYKTIGFEFTIDRTEPVIRQWIYSDSPAAGWRLVSEVQASRWVAKNNPAAFDDRVQREKLTLDLTVYSLVSYLTHKEYDWQLQRESYGGLELSQTVSRPEDCSYYSESDLKQQLSGAGNLFAGAPLQLLAGKICLPPKTDMRVSSDTVTLRNRFCELIFKAKNPAHSILYVDPKTRSTVQLPNGESRYEIHQMGFTVETIFFGLRAQHKDNKKYRDWASRVVDGAGAWFAPGNPGGQPQRLLP